MKKIHTRQYSETQVYYEYDNILYTTEEAAIAKQQEDYEDTVDNRFQQSIIKNRENEDKIAE